jgi:hypothetical protein
VLDFWLFGLTHQLCQLRSQLFEWSVVLDVGLLNLLGRFKAGPIQKITTSL